MMIKESSKRQAIRILAYASWLAALGLTYLRVAGVGPQSLGVIIILLIGVAIAAGLSMSRAKLGDTITGAFMAGMAAARAVHDDDDPES